MNLIPPQAQSMVGDKIPGMGGGAAEAPADGEAPAEVGLCQQHHHCHHHHYCYHHHHHHHQYDLGKICFQNESLKRYQLNDNVLVINKKKRCSRFIFSLTTGS